MENFQCRLPRINTGSRQTIPVKTNDGENWLRVHEFKLPPLPVIRKTKKNQEGIKNYITKKRELQIIQFNLNLKEVEINDLVSFITKEEHDLSQAESVLETETKTFQEFLQESKRLATEASENAEITIKFKMEKVLEIKRLHDQLGHIKQDISKYQDSIKESQTYEQFFTNLIPKSGTAFSPKDLFEAYDKIREEILKLIEGMAGLQQSASFIKEHVNWLNDTIGKTISSLREDVTKYTTTLVKLQENDKALTKDYKGFQQHLVSDRYKTKRKQIDLIDDKINEVYKCFFTINENQLQECSDIGGLPTFQLGELEDLLEKLTVTVNSLPRNKVLALIKLRKRQRREFQRRSRLLTAKSDGNCPRCEKRNKLRIIPNVKAKKGTY